MISQRSLIGFGKNQLLGGIDLFYIVLLLVVIESEFSEHDLQRGVQFFIYSSISLEIDNLQNRSASRLADANIATHQIHDPRRPGRELHQRQQSSQPHFSLAGTNFYFSSSPGEMDFTSSCAINLRIYLCNCCLPWPFISMLRNRSLLRMFVPAGQFGSQLPRKSRREIWND